MAQLGFRTAVTTAAMRFMPLWAVIAGGLLLAGSMVCANSGAAAANERTRRLAREDPVSGLPAATAILETLEHTLAQREPDEFVTLCYLDLTGFRELADTFGRPWSQDLVRAVADRLRELDWPGSALGRLGRHRFLLLLRAKDPDAGMRMAQEVDNLITKPMTVEGQLVYLGRISVSPIRRATRPPMTCTAVQLAMRAARRVSGRHILSFASTMGAICTPRATSTRARRSTRALELHASRSSRRARASSASRRCCAGGIPRAAISLPWCSSLAKKRA